MGKVNKYRGKRIHALAKGTWIYGYLCDESHINAIVLEGEFLAEFMVDKDTVGQYIGVNDKNGKEIYTGDIVKTKDGE